MFAEIFSIVFYLFLAYYLSGRLSKRKRITRVWAFFFLFFWGIIIGWIIVSSIRDKNNLQNDNGNKINISNIIMGSVCLIGVFYLLYVIIKLINTDYEYQFYYVKVSLFISEIWVLISLLGSSLFCYTRHLYIQKEIKQPINTEKKSGLRNIVEALLLILFITLALCALITSLFPNVKI